MLELAQSDSSGSTDHLVGDEAALFCCLILTTRGKPHCQLYFCISLSQTEVALVVVNIIVVCRMPEFRDPRWRRGKPQASDLWPFIDAFHCHAWKVRLLMLRWPLAIICICIHSFCNCIRIFGHSLMPFQCHK